MTLVAVDDGGQRALKSNTRLFLGRRPCPGSFVVPVQTRPRDTAALHELLRSQSGYDCGPGSSSPALFHISRVSPREGTSICVDPPQTFCPTWISRWRMWKPFFVQCSTVRNERILEEAISSLALDPQLRRHPRHALQYVRTQEIRTITDACEGDRHFQKPKVVSLLTSEGLSFIAVGRRGRCSVSDGSFESDSC